MAKVKKTLRERRRTGGKRRSKRLSKRTLPQLVHADVLRRLRTEHIMKGGGMEDIEHVNRLLINSPWYSYRVRSNLEIGDTVKRGNLKDMLPPHWVEKVSRSTGATWYSNPVTNEKTFEDPRISKPGQKRPEHFGEGGWEEGVVEGWYYNMRTGKKSQILWGVGFVTQLEPEVLVTEKYSPSDAGLTWDKVELSPLPIGSGHSGNVWIAQHSTLDFPDRDEAIDRPDPKSIQQIFNAQKESDDVGSPLSYQGNDILSIAVKVEHDERSDDLMREINALIAIAGQPHPHLMRMYDYSNTYIIMEHLKGGDLLSYISIGAHSEEDARYYMRQIISAVAHLHDTIDYAHRDLKFENIMLTDAEPQDGYHQLKIGDFGFAVDLRPGRAQGVCGTPNFVAPEIDATSYDARAVDMFACGVIFYTMLCLKYPFNREPQLIDKLVEGEKARKILSGVRADSKKFKETQAILEDISRFKKRNFNQQPLHDAKIKGGALIFIKRLLDTSPEQRPTAKWVLEDPDSWLFQASPAETAAAAEAAEAAAEAEAYKEYGSQMLGALAGNTPAAAVSGLEEPISGVHMGGGGRKSKRKRRRSRPPRRRRHN